MDRKKIVETELAVLPLKSAVVYPSLVMPLMVTEARYARLIDDALMAGDPIVLVAQRDPEVEFPKGNEIFKVGTVGSILKMLRFPDGSVRFLTQGIARVKIKKITQEEPYLKGYVNLVEEETSRDVAEEALVRNIHEQLKKIVQLAPYLPDDLQVSAMNTEDSSKLADLIASNLNIDTEQKQEILEVFDVRERLKRLTSLITKEIEVLEMSKKIQTEAASEMGKSQREYILREQLKAIKRELGEADDQTMELEEFQKKIDEAKMPEEAKEAADKELDRLSKMNPSAAEYTVSRTYLDWLVTLPWSISTEDMLDIKKAQKILDEDHYDLEKVKERILEYLAVRKLKSDLKGPILCFLGPPGVGKTSLGRSIARAMGRKFHRISLGGVRDEAEIRGHRRTYIGALPGRVIQGLRKAGSNNPIFMLDEIDKIGQDFRGDPASALLEVLDPEQNNSFSDHYLDVIFDLSKVMFITTANMVETIPPVLLDRMEVIPLPGYTDMEKLAIAKKYLIPRNLMEHGLNSDNLAVKDAAIKKVISDYTRESGLRNLNREIGSICRKVAKSVASGQENRIKVDTNQVRKYLGPERFIREVSEKWASVGVVPGLAYTSAGGDILFIEATKMPGKKMLELTGQLGDVMKESVKAAMSYLQANADKMGIPQKEFETHNFHIHVPAGATPKDGPSAGITMCTALASVLLNKPVAPHLAMTGEITLRGDILPIGGLKQKALAAYRAGIKKVLIPKKNEGDLEEIPKEIKSKVKFIFIERVSDVFHHAFGIRMKDDQEKSTREQAGKPSKKKIKTTGSKARKKSVGRKKSKKEFRRG
ncbi:MAG: endopeptidase La [Candidatus Zixiibacteriota bacterium]|nr:MAG: endopeptidase La [candidate division Zixibacteria bacterium]